MARYDANFNLETLYSVAREMDNFGAQQDYSLSCIESETFYFEQAARESLHTVERRLEKEKCELENLKAQLEDAVWHMDNCQQTDEDGNTTGEYEYWARVVSSLESAVDRQAAVVERVQCARDEVRRLSADLSSRSVQLRSLTHAYSSSASGYGSGAATAIRHCADAMNGYWNSIF